MNTLFGKLFLTFTIIITVLIISFMAGFTLFYRNSFTSQVMADNDKQAMNVARSLYSFMHSAYKVVEELAYNSDVLSMDTERQTAVFVSSIERNDYFELLYAQGMDGMQTGRSTGELGNRKERWWFIQMEETGQPFISESYYSVGTNMPCASIFYPMTDGEEMIGIMAGDIRLSSLHDMVVEAADMDAGTWAFILDGKGVVVAHPDSTYQEELYNYLTLTKTVTIKDETGVPIQDAAGNLTEEQSFEISDAYKAAIANMMRGKIDSTYFEEDGKTIFLSYRPVQLDGFSEPWYVLSVKDGDVVLQSRSTVTWTIIVSSVAIIITAVLLIMFTLRNIGSRVEMDAIKARHEMEKAQASERAKSEFLATMSHEIRTPMNAILGVTEIALQNENIPKEYSDAFETIYSSGNNLLNIINDILDMSKIETGKLELNPTQYQTPSLINDTIQLNAVRISKKPIKFVLDMDENLPKMLYGDELRIKQILNNLLSNAIKYTKKGEVKLTIRFEAKNEKTKDEIFLIFKVTDTGQGMKPEDLKNLFTEYLRFNAEANRATEGTGLGLCITKKLAELMGGTVTAESVYGEGSEFTVKIIQKVVNRNPVGAEITESLQGFEYIDTRFKERRRVMRTPMPYGRVLVVDDVESNLYVAEGLLAQYELQTETVSSGFSAIEKVSAGGTYDIILMDHMMPQMDGIETTKKLRGLGYEGPIVALTANALAGSDEMFRRNGFDGFIPKPIDIRRLDMTLNEFIRDRHPEEAGKYKPEEPQSGKTGKAGTDAKPVIDARLAGIFTGEAEKAISTLRDSAASGDLKLFTTTAHAMKSALGNVGEHEASEAAYALEQAGNAGDTELISAETEGFIKLLGAIIRKLKSGDEDDKPAAGDNTVIAEDTAFLAQQLDIIKTACTDYDDSTAYSALDALKKTQWKPETEKNLDGIRSKLHLDSDFEGAARLAEILKESLQGS